MKFDLIYFYQRTAVQQVLQTKNAIFKNNDFKRGK